MVLWLGAVHRAVDDFESADPFRCARGNQHAVGWYGDATRRVLGSNRLARSRYPSRGDITVVPISHGSCDGFYEVRRSVKTERNRVPDVQITDSLPLRLDRLRFSHDVADGIGKSIDASGHRDRPGTCSSSAP